MTFGEALRSELIQIEKLNEKIFPVVAPGDAVAPFLAYRRADSEFKKTLSGTSNKAHAIYSLTLLTKNYAEKEELESQIIEKLLNFQSRNIGISGPYIQNVTIRLTDENYAFEPDLLSSSLRLEVDY
jgi:hypothetical protein